MCFLLLPSLNAFRLLVLAGLSSGLTPNVSVKRKKTLRGYASHLIDGHPTSARRRRRKARAGQGIYRKGWSGAVHLPLSIAVALSCPCALVKKIVRVCTDEKDMFGAEMPRCVCLLFLSLECPDLRVGATPKKKSGV